MRAGFGRSDITPRPGVQLTGYGPYRNRHARAIHAPLHARAAVIESQRRRVVVLSLDLCGLSRELAGRTRQAAAAAARTPVDEIFLSVTHTHSGPATAGLIGWGEPDALYVETLPSRVETSVRQAVGNITPVEWRSGIVPCEGIAVNRERDIAYAHTTSVEERLAEGWRPPRPELTDPRCRVLAGWSNGRLAGVFHHFGCHAVVCGEKTDLVHGDFVGAASSRIEQQHPESVAIFLPGAIGDINPSVCHRPLEESLHATEVLGARYADAVQRGIDAAQPWTQEARRLDCRTERVRFSRVPWSRDRIDRMIRVLEKRLHAPGLDDLSHVGAPPMATNGIAMVRLEGLRRIRAAFRGVRAPNPTICLQTLGLGPLTWVGAGLEVYHELGLRVARELGEEHTWVISLAGEGCGYATDARARRKKTYAASLVPFILGELPFTGIDRELPGAMARCAKRLGSS